MTLEGIGFVAATLVAAVVLVIAIRGLILVGAYFVGIVIGVVQVWRRTAARRRALEAMARVGRKRDEP